MAQLIWKLAPSIIEQYFAHGNCVRSLVTNGIINNAERAQFGFAEKENRPTSLADAGNRWETTVLDRLRHDPNVTYVFSGKEGVNSCGEKIIEKYAGGEFAARLSEIHSQKKQGVFYVYQPELRITEAFFLKNISAFSNDTVRSLLAGSGAMKIDVSRPIFPDLIRMDASCDGKIRLSVVDIKLAKKPKLEHKMQIAMYILLLEDFVEVNRLADICEVNTETGYLYNFGQSAENGFPTEKVFHFLRRFLNTVLPEIVETVRNDPLDGQLASRFSYHITQKCEWCPNYEKCIESCKESGEEVMLLPYITPYAQDHLRSIGIPGQKPFSIPSFSQYIDSDSGKETLSANSYWKRFLQNGKENLAMLARNCQLPFQGFDARFLMKETAAPEMPQSEDVQIILTAQKDEAFDKCYLWSIRVSTSKEGVIPTNMIKASDGVQVFYREASPSFVCSVIAKDMNCQRDAAKTFIKVWYNAVFSVSEHNKDKAPQDRLSLQHFVMDNYELLNVKETLFDVIENDSDAELRTQATALLLLLQGKELVESDQLADRPRNTLDFPVVVLTTSISKLFILPAFISYSIYDICNAFSDGENGKADEIRRAVSKEGFSNKKSNVIRSDRINDYWKSGNEEILPEIGNYIDSRLRAESLLIADIRKTKHNGIAYLPGGFLLPSHSSFEDQLFNKLYFEVLYEAQLGRLQLVQARSVPYEQAVADGTIWMLKKEESPGGFERNTIVFSITNSEVVQQTNIFNALVFVEDEDIPDARKALPFYNDLADETQNNHFLKKQFPHSLMNFYQCSSSFFRDDGCTLHTNKTIKENKIVFKVSDNTAYAQLTEACNIVGMTSMFSNITSVICLNNLGKADAYFKHLLSPTKFFTRFDDADYQKDRDSLIGYGKIGNENFTNSQENALRHLFENNITLLQGPPGTGKTDFISRAILSLSRFYKAKGKALKVLVCANSHAAIENVLFKIGEMMEKMGLTENDVSIAKLNQLERKAHGTPIKEYQKRTFGAVYQMQTNGTTNLVVGATAWAVSKYYQEVAVDDETDAVFDLIVIDEASQVKMADAIIPLMHGQKETSRFLIVGDENQLPPILAGQYEKDEDKPFIFGSVFRYYSDCDRLGNPEHSYVVSLEDNFRSNGAIIDYSARRIYGSSYKPFSEKIGGQTLRNLLGDDNWIRNGIEEIYSDDSEYRILSEILNPNYPVVLCCVKGANSAEIKQNEVDFVTKVTKAFAHLRKKKENDAYTQDDFWGNAPSNGGPGDFGIVSPHHEHILALKHAIADSPIKPFDAENIDSLFIGTVDKLQGQEREAIVVSYGVSDVEQALKEGEFIFSRNRLNVAITRAKKKCIIFLNEALLSYPSEALAYDDQELLEGIDYMCGFLEYMKSLDASPIVTDKITIYRR